MDKICKKCQVPKPEDSIHFRPNGHAKGLRHACRECESRILREGRANDPVKRAACAAAARKWAKDNREQHNASKRARYAKDSSGHKKNARKANYGITDFQFQQKLAIQSGGCAICGFVFPAISGGNRELAPHVDHDHATGKVRGILCHNCNKGLGHFKDKQNLLESAIFYLKILG